MPGTDDILAFALVALYLADSVLLLARHEAVIVMKGASISRITLGSDFTLAGRRTELLNPLLPHRLAFKADWSLKDASENSADDAASAAARVAAALRPVGVASMIAAFSGIAGAPLALLTGRPLWFLAFWSACVLSVIVGGCFALSRHRALGISKLSVSWLVLVAAVCIPYAGTLARTLAQRTRLKISLPDFAHRFLREPSVGAFNDQFLALLARFRHQAEDGSPAAQKLDSLIAQLRKAVP